MTRKIGANTNTYDIGTNYTVTLNNTTTTTLLPANEQRIGFIISNPTGHNVWLKFQEASVDDTKHGIFLPACAVYESAVIVYCIGEISAIADTGNPTLYVVEI